MEGNTLDERRYAVLLKHAINGFRKLNLHSLIENTVRTERLELNPFTNTANLPNDFIDWFKVGAIYRFNCGLDEQGNDIWRERIVNLDYNPNIRGVGSELRVCECNDVNINQAFVGSGEAAGYRNNDPAQTGWYGWLYYAPRVNNGQYTAGLYGVGQNVYRGSFVVDLPNQLLRFSSCITHHVKEILLEYRATGLSADGNAIIPQDSIPSLIAYVKWKDAEDKKDMTWARYFMAEFNSEAMALNMRNNAISEHDWYTLMRETLVQTPKG